MSRPMVMEIIISIIDKPCCDCRFAKLLVLVEAFMSAQDRYGNGQSNDAALGKAATVIGSSPASCGRADSESGGAVEPLPCDGNQVFSRHPGGWCDSLVNTTARADHCADFGTAQGFCRTQQRVMPFA